MDLNAEEITLAREVVEQAYQDLREEIYKTEDTDYKRQLKAREATLQSLIAKLSAAEPARP